MTPLDYIISIDNEVYSMQESLTKSLFKMLGYDMQLAVMGFLQAFIGIACDAPLLFPVAFGLLLYSAIQICSDFELFEEHAL
jgi:hypothetical protein